MCQKVVILIAMMNRVTETKENMASGTFRLKSRELLDKYGQGKTMYRIAKDANTNYSTILYLFDEEKRGRGVQVDTLFSFLSGLGLSLEEIKDMPLGDVFEFSPEDNGAA